MTSKDKYYWGQLRGALTAGQWSSSFPAKAPNGSALSWSELFRKFNKHCPGYRDVTEVASQNHALALLLASNYKDEDEDDGGKPGEYALDLGDEGTLPEERITEARKGYEILKKLESSNFDTLNFALAYYAYALGDAAECLSHLSKVPDVSHVQNHIPLPGTLRANTKSLHVPAANTESSASSATTSFVSESTVSVAEIKDGRAWAMTETFRSLCLQGMSHEKLSPSDPQQALKSYSAAFPLLTLAESEIASKVTPTMSGKIDFSSFTRFRELWRWVERLIWRATVLAAQTYDIHHDHPAEGTPTDSLWTWLGHYSACSAYWPSNFRPTHRSTISVLYLRALVIRYGSLPQPHSGLKPLVKPPPWMHTARSVVQEYRAILSVSTHFPRAGERNVKVEEFVDLCVAVWEAGGGGGEHHDTGWVLDVLWWATRMTFNSFRTIRHMTRLLHISGDTALAKRTLRLYVQIVGKAWQASDAGVGSDADTDRKWVETLVFGVRMLCKESATSLGLEGMDDVREAGTLVDKAKSRLDKGDKELVASVDLAEGIWQSVLALKEQDPHSRPTRLASAQALFLRSVSTHPTPSAYYHLALSYSHPGPSQDLEQAIINAGLAVESDSREIRYWHLLGLLSAATEQWDAADGALESGATMGEEIPAEAHGAVDGRGIPESNDLTVPTGDIQAKDFAKPKSNGTVTEAGNGSGNGNGNPHNIEGLPPASLDSPQDQDEEPQPSVYLLERGATSLPLASDLLQPAQTQSPPTRHELFEHALQLRMTQVALAEFVAGPEGAENKLPEVFQWIAERKGVTGDSRRTSMDGGRSTETRLKSPSELLLPTSQASHDPEKVTPETQQGLGLPMSRTTTEEPSNPIPITISPATPDDASAFQGEPLKRALTHDRDASKSKKVQQMLKDRVHKSRAGITTISKKIGNGVVRNGSLRRSNSTPDFHAALHHTSYQASSIHSRRRLSSFIRSSESVRTESPPPPPVPPLPPSAQTKANSRIARENRLLSNLWLMSAATFRRQGKIEQAKGAIQEAEVRDENNPAVWVQLGLYHVAHGQTQNAIESFRKALFISPDDVAASVHLCRLYLTPDEEDEVIPDNVDLAAGILSHLTKGAGWDVPEAWYFLAKAYGLQGRKDRERECLSFALGLSESRGVREIRAALGWCI